MRLYVCTAISLQMFQFTGTMRWQPLSGEPKAFLAEKAATHDIVHAIGHKDLADITGFPFRRESIEADPGDLLLVCQYRGPRLAEGQKLLPPDATLTWYVVEVLS